MALTQNLNSTSYHTPFCPPTRITVNPIGAYNRGPVASSTTDHAETPSMSTNMSAANMRQASLPSSRILQQNAEAGPSNHQYTRSRSSIAFSDDGVPPTAQDVHSLSSTHLPYQAARTPNPPPLVSRKSDPVIIRPMPPVNDPVDPLDVTDGFEPLSPIVFGEPFGQGSRSDWHHHSSRDSNGRPVMSERSDGVGPTVIARDHARLSGTGPDREDWPGGILAGGGTGVAPMRNHAPWVRRTDAQPTSTRAMSTSSSLSKLPVSPEILPDRQSSFFGSIDIPVERKEGEGRCSWLAEVFIGATLCQCLPFFRYDPEY